MKQLFIILLCLTCAVVAYAKPQCQGFNNYDNKVTIVFTDDAPSGRYEVTDAKLTPSYGKNRRQVKRSLANGMR